MPGGGSNCSWPVSAPVVRGSVLAPPGVPAAGAWRVLFTKAGLRELGSALWVRLAGVCCASSSSSLSSAVCCLSLDADRRRLNMDVMAPLTAWAHNPCFTKSGPVFLSQTRRQLSLWSGVPSCTLLVLCVLFQDPQVETALWGKNSADQLT